jgi:hypothetical protein
MEIECGCMEKSLLTDGTLIGKFSLVRLHMIMHCILTHSNFSALATHIVAILILLILKDHSSCIGGSSKEEWSAEFNFFWGGGS